MRFVSTCLILYSSEKISKSDNNNQNLLVLKIIDSGVGI